jgi:hypothetical protein
VTIASNGTGSVTLVTAPTGATQIAIVGNRSIARTTDFVTGGDFFANTVNNELDQQTIFAQQNAEGLGRALQAPQTDPTTIDMTLPRASVRANKTLAFDADGNPVTGEQIGDYRDEWASGTAYNKRDIVKDGSNNNVYFCVEAHTSSGTTPISSNSDSAKWSVLVDASSTSTSASEAATSATNAATSASSASSSAATAATQATNAATSATDAASAKAAAESARDSTLAAFDSFDDRYLGAKSSDPSVDNDGNALAAGSLYFNSASGAMKIYTGSAWVAAYVSGGGYLVASNNLSDVSSASTARTNLGLAIGSNVQAYNAATALTNAAQQFTATQTFSGSSSSTAIILNDAAEVVTVSATAASGTINYDITTQSVLYYTSNASANWTKNFRGSSGTSLNTLMSTGQSMTVAFIATQGGTAYYNSSVQVDGTTSGVTTKWQGGTAPTAGNASSIDVYTYTIIKTASATFTVLASQTKFA